MSTKTISEKLFEEFCDRNGLPWEKVEEGNIQSADYKITNTVGEFAFCEVKQREVRGESPWPEKLETIRNIIRTAGKQLRNTAAKKYPTVVVIYDNSPGDFPGDVDYTLPYQIQKAMYGEEVAVLEVHPKESDPNREYQFRGFQYGGKRCLNDQHNTSISAVALLLKGVDDSLSLKVFQNLYAAVPLQPEKLRTPSIRHFSIESNREFEDWKEIKFDV